MGKASLETLLRLPGNPGTNALLALWGGLSSNPTQQGISQPKLDCKGFKKNWIDGHSRFYAWAQGAESIGMASSHTPAQSAVPHSFLVAQCLQ